MGQTYRFQVAGLKFFMEPENKTSAVGEVRFGNHHFQVKLGECRCRCCWKISAWGRNFQPRTCVPAATALGFQGRHKKFDF